LKFLLIDNNIRIKKLYKENPMAMPRPSKYPDQPKPTPLNKGLEQVKQHIDEILQKMKKDPKFLPKQTELDAYSNQVVQLIQNYHPKITPEQKNLLAAVIDLNEVPLMHPQMQRIAFETALREASKNLEHYLTHN
jgi:hypothetical protein